MKRKKHGMENGRIEEVVAQEVELNTVVPT